MKYLRRPLRLASLVLLFLLEDRADLLEGGVRLEHGDEGLLLLELIAETLEEGVDESTILDVIAKFTEFIADVLDSLAEDGDWVSPWTVVRSSVLSVLIRGSELS